MDSLVKCGNGYGYGYGNSKPQMNYHRQNTESVTTVVTEINRMTVNDDKPCYAGGVQKQQACKVEAFQEHDEAYNGAVAVHQKHSFKEEEEKYGAAAVKNHDEYKEKYGEVVDAEYGSHHYGGGGAAVKKQGYGYKQEAYGETEAAAGYGAGAHYGGAGGGKNQGYNYKQEAYGGTEAAGYGGGAHYGAGGGVKKQGYGYTQEECGESDVAGYGAHHGGAGAAVQTYAYDQQAAYGGAIGAAVQQQAYKHKDAASKMNGSQQKVYGYGESVDAAGAGYGAHYGGGAVHQQHGYQKDAYGYGAAAAAGGKVKNNGYQYQEAAYGGTGAGGYGAHYGGGAGGTDAGGYGAHYGGGGAGAVQQYGYQKDAYGYGGAAAGGKVKKGGYQYQEAYGGTGAGGYGAHYGGGAAAVQKHGYMQDVYESETESESDDSDCEEAFPPRGGAQQSYGVYKQEKHGAANLGLGGVRRYESYESREELGGGRRYETYQTTVQYTGGSGGGGSGYATCSPIKNRHLLRYGA